MSDIKTIGVLGAGQIVDGIPRRGPARGRMKDATREADEVGPQVSRRVGHSGHNRVLVIVFEPVDEETERGPTGAPPSEAIPIHVQPPLRER